MSYYSAGSIIVYIQNCLYDGRQPDQSGYYCFSRKELAENAEIALSTFDRCKEEVIHYFKTYCDFASWAKYKEFAGEVLYTEVSYERGLLKFKRNPLTQMPEFSFLWGLPPLGAYFSYDFFDEKHRRRLNGSKMCYDAIPWSWNADEYETELNEAREAIRIHQEHGAAATVE